MLNTILIVLAVLVAALVIIVAMQPPDFRITRKATFTAAPAAVFALVNDLHQWEAWSPWAKLDPAAKMTFEGPPTGAGSGYTWEGNNKVGQGRMTILESRPSELIRLKLEFLKPFKATNTAEFTFKSEGSQTLVTWSMSGKNNFMGKAIGLVMDCDKLVGGQFEKGLADMKALVEAGPK